MILFTKRSKNGSKIAIMDKSCGQFQQKRAKDGKLKSNLERPNITDAFIMWLRALLIIKGPSYETFIAYDSKVLLY